MTRMGMSILIGKAVTDEVFLNRLCDRLKKHDKEELKEVMEWAEIDLDDNELDYLVKEQDLDICQCLRILRKCLEIEYDSQAHKRQ